MRDMWTARTVWRKRVKLQTPVLGTLLVCVIVLQFLYLVKENCSHEIVVDQAPSLRGIKGIQDFFTEPKRCACKDEAATVLQEDPLLFPVLKRDKTFLTIGIPTIQRKGDSYLLKTIASLKENMHPDEYKEVIIVVFLADRDPAIRRTLADDIKSNFSLLIEVGMLHVIQAPDSYYPPINITKFTYGQPENYIKWRSKQNFDYAFVFDYSVNMSQYYMQLEDDVITMYGYISSIKQFITQQSAEKWTCLEFSELGFIAKLYRNTDLPKLASMMRLFYEEQPVDATYLYFNMMNTQMVRRLRKPTLFQHQGIKSSFPGKIQPLKDRFFDNMTKTFTSDNPPAEVFSSMKEYLTFMPKMAYEKTEGYFWSHGSPTDGDTVIVVFQQPQQLRRVVVLTGSIGHPEDRLINARLDVSLTLAKSENSIQCINDITVGEFVNGTIDVNDLEQRVKFQVMCLKVRVTKIQEPWVIVREIAVFTSKSDKR